jgi:hypothetical protein
MGIGTTEWRIGTTEWRIGTTEWRIGTTEWQLRVELDTWLPVETSRRTPQFHVTSIKCVIKYD